jgi:hypothetical protein
MHESEFFISKFALILDFTLYSDPWGQTLPHAKILPHVKNFDFEIKIKTNAFLMGKIKIGLAIRTTVRIYHVNIANISREYRKFFGPGFTLKIKKNN